VVPYPAAGSRDDPDYMHQLTLHLPFVHDHLGRQKLGAGRAGERRVPAGV
jgi:hypothetical protein